MEHLLFDSIAALYEARLQVPHNEICRRCDARFKRPLLPWHVGGAYESDALRLLFIGKPHREDRATQLRAAGTQDGRQTADELFAASAWPFWSYTREILRKVYGSNHQGWERIVLTTIVKCTNVAVGESSNDSTSLRMCQSCISDVGVIRNELGIFDPRHIILYTGTAFDRWLGGLLWREGQKWVDHTPRDHRVSCGRKKLAWWEREIQGDTSSVRVLRVGHPERMNKGNYTSSIAAWVQRERMVS